MKLTLIITTYNWPESLLLVIESIRNQKMPPFEIIVADDGSDNKTKDLITKFNKECAMNIIHSWQEDNGFRAARSRNNAIYKSNGDYIVLIDGDVILHPKFLQDHIANAEIGYFVQGSRVLLSKSKTKKIIRNKNINLTYFSFTTNVGVQFTIGKKNPIWVEAKKNSDEFVPYSLVNKGLIAKVSRAVYYELVGFLDTKNIKNLEHTGIYSGKEFFILDKPALRNIFI